MRELDGLSDLGAQLDAVDISAAQAGQMVAGFDGELQRLRGGLQHVGGDLASFEKGLQKGMRKARRGTCCRPRLSAGRWQVQRPQHSFWCARFRSRMRMNEAGHDSDGLAGAFAGWAAGVATKALRVLGADAG